MPDHAWADDDRVDPRPRPPLRSNRGGVAEATGEAITHNQKVHAMKPSSNKLLLWSLAIAILPACGLDAGETESSLSADLDQTGVNPAPGEVRSATPGARVVLAPNAVREPAPFSPVGPLGLILIDRTGSMSAIRPSTGHSRCADALAQAHTQLSDFATKGVNSFAVWTFAGTSVTRLTAGYVSQALASTAIDTLTPDGCLPDTPLAYAMCAAAQDLGQTRSSSSEVAWLGVSTDGGENNSAGSPLLAIGNTNCSGSTGDITTPGTWENNVDNYIKTTIGNIKVDNTYWINPALLTSLRTAGMAGCSGDTQCDDEFFSALSNITGGNYRRAPDNTTTYPCAPGSCPAPNSNNVGNRFSFSAVNTNNDTVNTTNYSVYLLAGETITAGTCGVAGSAGTGDTILRVFSPSGSQVAFNDDSCGVLSSVTYTATTTGNHLISAGCFSINSCSGTVAFTIQGSFSYSASNTSSDTVNTANRNVYLRPAQTIALGTCGVTGSSGTGDTYLRLFDPANTNVATNDDSCGLLSSLSYSVPAGAEGNHQIHAGCFSSLSCSGTVAYLITQP